MEDRTSFLMVRLDIELMIRQLFWYVVQRTFFYLIWHDQCLSITIQVLPCDMARLKELNNALRERSSSGLLSNCVVCDKPSKQGCGKCRSRYCSKVCKKTVLLLSLLTSQY